MRSLLLKFAKRLAQSLALLVLFTSASLFSAIVYVQHVETGEETSMLNGQMVNLQLPTRYFFPNYEIMSQYQKND